MGDAVCGARAEQGEARRERKVGGQVGGKAGPVRQE
jgi:hypothetical protein